MRISDWSSDVCSSDLDLAHLAGGDILLASRQGSLRLGKDSLLDASAGGAIMEDGKTAGAAGGDVALLVDGTFHRKEMNELVLGGDIRYYGSEGTDRKSTRLNSRHYCAHRMPSFARKKKTSYFILSNSTTY